MQSVEIRVKGQIDEHWSEWFDDLTTTHTDQNETVLTGPIPDQAALHGLLAKLRDLGLPITQAFVPPQARRACGGVL